MVLILFLEILAQLVVVVLAVVVMAVNLDKQAVLVAVAVGLTTKLAVKACQVKETLGELMVPLLVTKVAVVARELLD
jgi:hypothetical protein